MEERRLPNLSEVPSYPDNWPLPPTPLDISSESMKEAKEMPKTRSGVITPPLQKQPAAQPTPPMSATSSNRPLRSLSNSSAKSPHRKRLSLSFPVAPSVRTIPSAYASPSTPTTPTDYSQLSPNDSMAFLTALAAQERRVLELREELQKAETELTKLKRQWSIHEATKKRHELIQTEIVRGAIGNGDLSEGLKSPTIEEHEARRRAALAKLTQSSTRSVTGQRHHRTLSLLSPQRTSYSQPFPQPKDLQDDAAESVRAPTPVRRSDTLPVSSARPMSMIETSSSTVGAALGIKRNSQDVLRTGKQMAEGFREGLWAFVEDLRQATVGEDMPARPTGVPLSRSNSSLGAPAHGVKRQGSKASLRSVSSGGGSSRREREKSPAVVDNETDSRRGGTSHDDMLNSARWSTTSSSALSDTSSTVSAAHSRSSTPRTSTSSLQSSGFAGVGGTHPLPAGGMPGLGVFMSVGTQFSLKKAAGVVVRGLETALEGALALDEEEGRYKREVREREMGRSKSKREKEQEKAEETAEQASSRADNGTTTPTTLLRRRSVKATAAEGKTSK